MADAAMATDVVGESAGGRCEIGSALLVFLRSRGSKLRQSFKIW